MMSHAGDIKQEYKTIRISAPVYYKLVELTGIFSALMGTNMSITQMADMVIVMIHQNTYPEFLKIMNKPDEIQKMRTQFQEGIKNVYELFKDVKIIE